MGDIGGASGSEGQTGGWGDTTDQRPGRGLATASGTSSAVGQEGAGKVGQQRATSRSRSRAPREQSEDGRDGAAQAKKVQLECWLHVTLVKGCVPCRSRNMGVDRQAAR